MSFFNHFGYAGGHKHPLVFVHGAGMDSTVWASQARYFAARGHKVMAPDLPGHGHSKGKPLETIEEMSKWLIGELGKRGIGRSTMIGHSMGALIGLECSVERPGDDLILLGVASSMPVHPSLLQAAVDDLPQAASMIAEWGFVGGVQRQAQGLPSTSLMWSVRRLLERSRNGVLANDLRACANYTAAEQRVGERQQSLTVIAAEEDRMTSLGGAKKLVAVQNAVAEPMTTLEIVPKAGHMMFIEAPGVVRRLIANALN